MFALAAGVGKLGTIVGHESLDATWSSKRLHARPSHILPNPVRTIACLKCVPTGSSLSGYITACTTCTEECRVRAQKMKQFVAAWLNRSQMCSLVGHDLGSGSARINLILQWDVQA
jgi:hypothetical protein